MLDMFTRILPHRLYDEGVTLERARKAGDC